MFVKVSLNLLVSAVELTAIEGMRKDKDVDSRDTGVYHRSKLQAAPDWLETLWLVGMEAA